MESTALGRTQRLPRGCTLPPVSHAEVIKTKPPLAGFFFPPTARLRSGWSQCHKSNISCKTTGSAVFWGVSVYFGGEEGIRVTVIFLTGLLLLIIIIKNGWIEKLGNNVISSWRRVCVSGLQYRGVFSPSSWRLSSLIVKFVCDVCVCVGLYLCYTSEFECRVLLFGHWKKQKIRARWNTSRTHTLTEQQQSLWFE